MTEMKVTNHGQHGKKGGDKEYCKEERNNMEIGTARDNWAWEVESIGINHTTVEVYTLKPRE